MSFAGYKAADYKETGIALCDSYKRDVAALQREKPDLTKEKTLVK